MKMTRLTALVCCLVMLCLCFASCVTPGGTDQLQTDRYVATVTTKLATNDAKMKDVVLAAGAPVTTVRVDGDNLKIASEAKINDISMNNGYVYVDGVLYHSKQIAVSDKSVSSYTKADMSADQSKTLISSVGSGADISRSDFAAMDKITSGNTESYSCSMITDEARLSLCSVFADKLAISSASVTLEDVTYSEDYTDGRISSSVLSCNFIINMDGVEYSVTMHTYYSYDYNAEVSISAPADADKYNKVSIDEILK